MSIKVAARRLHHALLPAGSSFAVGGSGRSPSGPPRRAMRLTSHDEGFS